MSLTVNEVRAARDKLQTDILKLVQEFEEASTISVEDIRLEKGLYFSADRMSRHLRTDCVFVELDPSL
jgi:hypothetical protein